MKINLVSDGRMLSNGCTERGICKERYLETETETERKREGETERKTTATFQYVMPRAANKRLSVLTDRTVRPRSTQCPAAEGRACCNSARHAKSLVDLMLLLKTT
jgi:hypothetical protein